MATDVSPTELNLAEHYPCLLGIDETTERTLYAALVAALSCELPEGWTLQGDAVHNKSYFWNEVTGESSWTHPDHEIFAAVVDIYRASLEDHDPSRALQVGWKRLERQARADDAQWQGPFVTEEGYKYWHNPLEDKSSWQDPVDVSGRRSALRKSLTCGLLGPAAALFDEDFSGDETPMVLEDGWCGGGAAEATETLLVARPVDCFEEHVAEKCSSAAEVWETMEVDETPRSTDSSGEEIACSEKTSSCCNVELGVDSPKSSPSGKNLEILNGQIPSPSFCRESVDPKVPTQQPLSLSLQETLSPISVRTQSPRTDEDDDDSDSGKPIADVPVMVFESNESPAAHAENDGNETARGMIVAIERLDSLKEVENSETLVDAFDAVEELETARTTLSLLVLLQDESLTVHCNQTSILTVDGEAAGPDPETDVPQYVVVSEKAEPAAGDLSCIENVSECTEVVSYTKDETCDLSKQCSTDDDDCLVEDLNPEEDTSLDTEKLDDAHDVSSCRPRCCQDDVMEETLVLTQNTGDSESLSEDPVQDMEIVPSENEMNDAVVAACLIQRWRRRNVECRQLKQTGCKLLQKLKCERLLASEAKYCSQRVLSAQIIQRWWLAHNQKCCASELTRKLNSESGESEGFALELATKKSEVKQEQSPCCVLDAAIQIQRIWRRHSLRKAQNDGSPSTSNSCTNQDDWLPELEELLRSTHTLGPSARKIFEGSPPDASPAKSHKDWSAQLDSVLHDLMCDGSPKSTSHRTDAAKRRCSDPSGGAAAPVGMRAEEILSKSRLQVNQNGLLFDDKDLFRKKSLLSPVGKPKEIIGWREERTSPIRRPFLLGSEHHVDFDDAWSLAWPSATKPPKETQQEQIPALGKQLSGSISFSSGSSCSSPRLRTKQNPNSSSPPSNVLKSLPRGSSWASLSSVPAALSKPGFVERVRGLQQSASSPMLVETPPSTPAARQSQMARKPLCNAGLHLTHLQTKRSFSSSGLK